MTLRGMVLILFAVCAVLGLIAYLSWTPSRAVDSSEGPISGGPSSSTSSTLAGSHVREMEGQSSENQRTVPAAESAEAAELQGDSVAITSGDGQRGATIVGVVYTPDGIDAGGALVAVQDLSGETSPQQRRLRSTKADEQGGFEMSIPSGEWRIGVSLARSHRSSACFVFQQSFLCSDGDKVSVDLVVNQAHDLLGRILVKSDPELVLGLELLQAFPGGDLVASGSCDISNLGESSLEADGSSDDGMERLPVLISGVPDGSYVLVVYYDVRMNYAYTIPVEVSGADVDIGLCELDFADFSKRK